MSRGRGWWEEVGKTGVMRRRKRYGWQEEGDGGKVYGSKEKEEKWGKVGISGSRR
jgi:hypothetical protein